MNAKFESRVVLLAALLCAGTILAACGHDHNSFYPSLADADKAGETTHSWIPEFLPKTSRNIHEAHDLSPEYEWCAFEFDPADSDSLKRALTPVDQPTEVANRIPNPHVSWWPQVLTGDLKAGQIHEAGLRTYLFRRRVNAVETAGYLFAINWQKGQGFFYAR